jgi:hypothetical protein
MAENEKRTDWVYVVVCDPGANEHLLGLHDEQRDIDFIPAFRSREEATDCLPDMPRVKGKKREVQAMHIDELTEIAEKGGFVVAVVDKDGHIVE